MTTPAFYRGQAARSAQLAEAERDPVAKARLLEMSREFLELAVELERSAPTRSL
jgi:hypothetical protein